MTWFDRLFPAAMVLTPALIALCTRRHERLADDAAGPLMARLLAWTALLLVAVVGGQLLLELVYDARTGLRASFPIVASVLAFHFLWFGKAMPALSARDPGWRPTQAAPVRSASLRPRHLEPSLPTGAWVVAWLAFAGMTAAAIWAASAGAPWLLTIGLVFFPAFAWGARSTAFEPATFDPAGSADLATAYRDLRAMKAKGFMLLGLLGAGVFAATMVLVVVEPRWAAWSGALGGSMVGVMGGLFGVTASLIRAKANRLRAELVDEQRGSTA